jgi:hypothetical protein
MSCFHAVLYTVSAFETCKVRSIKILSRALVLHSILPIFSTFSWTKLTEKYFCAIRPDNSRIELLNLHVIPYRTNFTHCRSNSYLLVLVYYAISRWQTAIPFLIAQICTGDVRVDRTLRRLLRSLELFTVVQYDVLYRGGATHFLIVCVWGGACKCIFCWLHLMTGVFEPPPHTPLYASALVLYIIIGEN